MKKQNHLARLLGWTVALAGVLSMGHMARATIVYNNSTSPESPSVLLQNGFEFGDEVNLAGGVGTYLTNFTFQYFGSNLSANAWIQLRIYADNGQAYSLTNFNRTDFNAPGDMLYDSGTNKINDATGGATLSFDSGALTGNLAVHVPANFTWTVTFGGLGAGASAGLYLYSPPTVGSGYDDFWELSGTNGDWVYRATDSTNLDLSFAALAQGAVVVDANKPTLVIKVPANKAKLYSGSFGTNVTVSGTVTEKGGVTPSLVLFHNGTNGNFVAASVGSGLWSTPKGFVSIGADNFFQAKAVNKAGLESDLKTSSATLIVTNTFTLTVNAPAGTSGSTAVGSPALVVNGAPLVIGKAYKVTATPGTTCLFSNWTASVAGGPFAAVSSSAKYSFVMTTNLSLTANFSTNLFTALAGSYNGLFSDTNALVFTNSGYFSVKITSKPGKQATFSVKFVSAGKTFSGAGTFGLDGVGTLKKPISRAKISLPSLTCQLTVPLDGSSNITGIVTDGNWTASLSGAPIYVGTAYDNTYTMVVPSSGANIGNGYGTLTIIDGVTKLTGKLADGQKFAQTAKVNLHADGTWPLYVGEDKVSGVYYSSLIGTLQVATNFTLTATNLTWIKTGNNVAAAPAAGSFYTGGNAFTNVVGLNCSAFTNLVPVIPLHVLGLIPNHGVIELDNGGVTGGTITNGVTLSTANSKNKFTADPINVNKLTLTVSPKTGALTLGLKEGGTAPKGKGYGAVLQNQNEGLGYFFLDATTKSGSFSVK